MVHPSLGRQQGHRGGADLGAITALAGRLRAAATAGLRKASELFKHSCTIYSHNEPEREKREF